MFEQGDILLVPIPFTNLASNKKRPVLVLSNTEYNNKTTDIVVAAITSNITTKDFTVNLFNENMEEGSLKVDSCIRVDKIYALSQGIVIKKFGRIKSDILDEVRKKAVELFSEK